MIRLAKYSNQHYQDLTSYRLSSEQAQFTKIPVERLNQSDTLTGNTDNLLVSILFNNIAVGFFILDNGDDKFDYSQNPNALLLRSYSINPSYQGQGIAKQSLAKEILQPFVLEYFPKCNEIVLGVNQKNIPAYNLYIKAGFIDHEQSYMGIKGKQHILNLEL